MSLFVLTLCVRVTSGGNEHILKDVTKEKEQEDAGLNASGKLDRPGKTWKTLERHVRQLCVDFVPKVSQSTC